MDDLKKKLLGMKDKIDKAKSSSDRLKGALDQLTKRLETEYDIKSLKEADALLDELEEDIKNLKLDIEKQTKKLENDYVWS